MTDLEKDVLDHSTHFNAIIHYLNNIPKLQSDISPALGAIFDSQEVIKIRCLARDLQAKYDALLKEHI